MWSFQEHFRFDLGYAAEQAFGLIGLAVDPRALLVGFRQVDGVGRTVCLVPEDGPFVPEDLNGVLTRADVLYAEDEDRRMFVTGPGQQEAFEAGSLDKARVRALEEALVASNREPDRRFFVGSSRIVADYRVFPAVSVLAARWSSVPELPPYRTGRLRLAASFPEELLRQVLRSASVGLAIGSEPQRLMSVGRDLGNDLVRAAASSFLDSVPLRLGGSPSGLMEHLDAVAAAPYEGRPARGRLRFVPRTDATNLLLQFQSPVALSATRQARKLLEMTGPERHLVSDGAAALGVTAQQEDNADHGFEAVFTDRGAWTLTFDGTEMVQVRLGRAHQPKEALDFALFEDNFERLFGGPPGANATAVWRLVQVAATQEHGTMLVIQADAEGEGKRLGAQAVPIVPNGLNGASLLAASRIDGAVLVAPDGRCHAVGVILDGIASDFGDPGRGARFNSAVRYAQAHPADCLILVVSEDGTVELVPEPHRRVTRQFITAVVVDVERAANAPVDFEQFNRLVDRALAHRFYFSAEQCDRITAARELAETDRRGDIRMIVPRLLPDPRMNDSYFLREPEGELSE